MKKIFCLASLLILLRVSLGLAQSGRIELNVNYPAIGGLSTALWVAVEAKTFEKYGVKVNPIYIPTSALAVRAMLAGELPIGLGAGKPVIEAALAGADLTIIAGVVNVPAFYLMALPEIRSLQDLKGKTVGVTRLGSATDFTIRYVLRTAKINPEREVTVLQVGGMPELAAALSKKLIAAAALSPPTNLRAQQAGAKVLIDMAQAGVHFPHMVFFGRRSYLRTDQESVLNFLKGYADGLQRMASDKPLAKKVIQKYIRESNEEVLEATYQYGLDYIVRVPYPAREGIIEVLRQSEHPKAKAASPDEFVDVSLIKMLEKDGFFARR